MDIKERFEALSKSAHLDISILKTPDLDVSALLQNGESEELTSNPARRHLFFDEEARILVVLKTALPAEATRDLLPSLELLIVAHATDAVPQGSGHSASASGKHDLCSSTFAGDTFVDVVTLKDKTYVIFKPALHLSRPRTRLQRPAIYFTANLRIHENVPVGSRSGQNEVLRSYEPLSANVLEPLRSDPALRMSTIYLPESRITKVAPRAPGLHEAVKPIRGATKRAFPAVPALFSKIRYSALPDAILASLHVETSHIIAGTVTVSKVTVDVHRAHVHHITDVNLPLVTRAGDETVILYKLTPAEKSDMHTLEKSTPVSIAIEAEAVLDQGSRINMNVGWQTQVDLTQTVSRPTYRWSRPLSTSSSHQRGLSSHSLPDQPALDATRKQSTGEAGIVFDFAAPESAYKDENFVIRIQCRNRSGRPRRFALLMPQSRKAKPPAVPHTSKHEADLISTIFNAPRLEHSTSLSVLDLNPDVRIGPLSSGACFETQMKFRALRTGVLDLGTLRIIDLDSRQTLDVKELPDVIALDRKEPQD